MLGKFVQEKWMVRFESKWTTCSGRCPQEERLGTRHGIVPEEEKVTFYAISITLG